MLNQEGSGKQHGRQRCVGRHDTESHLYIEKRKEKKHNWENKQEGAKRQLNQIQQQIKGSPPNY